MPQHYSTSQSRGRAIAANTFSSPTSLPPGMDPNDPALDIKNTLFSGMFDDKSNPLGQAEKGQNFDFLADYLRQSLEGGMPFKDEFTQRAVGNVNTAFGKARTGMRETFADRGTFGSGIHAAASAELSGQQGAAVGGVVNQINLQDLEFRKDAIYKLLGLNKFDAESEVIAKQMLEQTRQFDVGLAENRRQFDESQPEWWELALSSIGGGIAGGATNWGLNQFFPPGN